MIVAYAGRVLLSTVFLALVLLLVAWQLFRGIKTGVIYVPGKRRIFKVVRAKEPYSFWGAIAFYCLILVALHMAAAGVLREVIWPGPSEPTRLTAVALDHSTVGLSWISPERRDAPPSYGIYRSTEPGGVELHDYQLVDTTTLSPYTDESLEPATRYFYRVAANYDGQPSAMSNEDSTVTSVRKSE